MNIQTITDEQKMTLMKATMLDRQNAWDYVHSRPENDQYWIAIGILSCIKKGYNLDRLSINWEARDARYINGVGADEVPATIIAPTDVEQFQASARLQDRSDILAYEQGLLSGFPDDMPGGSRRLAQLESDRLIAVAKATGDFIPALEWDSFGIRCKRPSGESIVYLDEESRCVIKAKDPFVVTFKNESPLEVLYLHHIHNFFFGNVRYRFLGISQDPFSGGARFIYEQPFIDTISRPTKDEINKWFESRGFHLTEDGYWFTDGHVSFTDVWADNCLKGTDGTLYFIDPMIKFEENPKKVIKLWQK